MENEKEKQLETLRHSASHILAQAVKNIYPTVKLAIGPAVKEGFYYDFEFKTPVTAEDFPQIEKEMEAIVRADQKFERAEVTRKKALDLMRAAGEDYKAELINDLPEGEKITLYKNGAFTDLCRGPHVESTGKVKAFKLTSVAGAYWRGSEKNKMLTRIYGTAFFTKEELDAYLVQVEEAKRRDHRVLGKQLELFHIDDTAPGMPFFLPRGWRVFQNLMTFWRREHLKAGYQEISGPQISHKKIWETSGHWGHYRDNMFLIDNAGKPVDFAIKPMNCPNAITVYQIKVRSYRDLPLRYSTNDVIHRNEKSGTLHGLLRVQMFRQDDAHIFVRKNQIAEEINAIINLADKLYGVLGLKCRATLSTRPEDFMGDKADWDKAEAELKSILDGRYGVNGYSTDEGGGAFYGPKIDFKMEDAIGREWQLGTVQLDFQLPLNFGLTYTESDGSLVPPVLIHRAVYGSVERFLGVLIEHFAGAFPFWLAPVPVGIVPIKPQHNEYALKVKERLVEEGIYAEIDLNDAHMSNKIKEYQLAKAPYILVVGDKEMQNGTVAVRIRGGSQIVAGADAFIAAVTELNKSRALELTAAF
ncbi:threonine--tRNA ligase [Clostridia bacterium]|nr:threonine--tRNA ligase [Clostridia bacterium]